MADVVNADPGATDVRATPDVVVVEDDDDNRRFVTSVLERAGLVVAAFSSAGDALVHLRESPCRVVVSDMRMPAMTGLEFTAIVRDRHPDTSVVLMTAYATVDNVIEALRLGASDLLQKPVTREVLVDKVRTLLAAPRAAALRRVLAVGAHPDDVEIGVGGILAAHRANGDPVTILTLTSGAVGGDSTRREEESREAADLLGATLVLARLPDTRLGQEPTLVGVIESLVESLDPDVVYTHGSNDLHQDHAAAHHATRVACRRVDSVYGYQSPSSTVEFAPTRFIPIDEHLDRKLAAIACYGSQTDVRDYLADDLLTATARYWGRFTKARYAEPLEVLAERAGFEATGVETAVAATADAASSDHTAVPAPSPVGGDGQT